MHHISTTAVIRCSDDLYHEGRHLYDVYMDILKAEDVDPNDPFKVFNIGSGIGFLIDPESQTLEIMVAGFKKSGIKKVVLIEHTPDCGGYAVKFGDISAKEERKLHLKAIEAAKKFFAQHLPDIELVCYLQNSNIDYELID